MIERINEKLSSIPHGKLAKECLNLTLKLEVLKSGAGWYLGTFDDCGPASRESRRILSNKRKC